MPLADGYVLRRATLADVPAIVALLAADEIGATRDGTDGGLQPYERAFEAIDDDPSQLLVVVVRAGVGAPPGADEVVATLQLTFIPGMVRRGAWRAQVEAVRVAAEARGSGLGQELLGWAVAEARRRGCALVQLTTDKRRTDAHRFYERLGFVASHEGYKLVL